ncbi:MAG: sigma-70 family RNA polymerase sigma factor [Elusimicrobia bacterium]|nr:sigma-70 family RNA polymerase sigma factor [Candidatus Obscuribacterium magneticum]
MSETSESSNQSEWIALLQQGDREALTHLVRTELPKIFNLCLRLCGRKADAEDLCQDVFVRAYQALKKFKGESSLSTWLYRIAVNSWKNRVRYEKRRFFSRHFSLSGETESDNNDSSALDLPDDEPGPEESAAHAENRQIILLALNELEGEDKTIIVLKDVEDRSYDEIASIMELNPGTVKSRLSRAREKLRDIYRRRGGKYT